MSKVRYEIVKHQDRLFFHDGEQYVLLDTGFFPSQKGWSTSSSGRIGPFRVSTRSKSFFADFIGLAMPDGGAVTAVFNPMDGYSCLLQGDSITISDEEMVLPQNGYTFDFVHHVLPLIDGSINGQPCRFLFDSGARMTMFGEAELADGAPVRTYREWMAMMHTWDDLKVYKLSLDLPNGFRYDGEGALVDDPFYRRMASYMGIRAMLGIDLFAHYDIAITAKGRRALILYEKTVA